jgi:glycosyltransferase involved in cell wall biosynthesis
MRIALIGRFEEGEIVAGPERVTRELFAELKRKNFQTIFIEYFFSGYKNSSIFKKLFGKEALNNNSIIRLGIFPLISFLIKEKYEIIHIVNLQRFILFLFLVRPFIKSHYIATLHGFLKYEIPSKNYLMKRYFLDLWVEKLVVKKCELLIFPSKLLFETFNKRNKISEGRYRIIPNGVSEIFKFQNTNFPSIENSLRIVFYNGSGDEINKGLDELSVLLKKAKCKIELFVLGRKGEVVSSDNTEIIYRGLKSHQEMIGFLKDKHFVIKSGVFDTFSIFVAECMSLGLVPIVNQNVGINEFIRHNVNGFIFNHSSSTDLPDLLNEIFGGKYDLKLISANAKKIYEVVNWNRISERYYESFERLIK